MVWNVFVYVSLKPQKKVFKNLPPKANALNHQSSFIRVFLAARRQFPYRPPSTSWKRKFLKETFKSSLQHSVHSQLTRTTSRLSNLHRKRHPSSKRKEVAKSCIKINQSKQGMVEESCIRTKMNQSKERRWKSCINDPTFAKTI